MTSMHFVLVINFRGRAAATDSNMATITSNANDNVYTVDLALSECSVIRCSDIGSWIYAATNPISVI